MNGGAGTVSTIAGTGGIGTAGDGGPALSAELEYPYAVTVGPAGVFIVEQDNDAAISRVRKIEPAGMALAYTRAGTGLGDVAFDPPGEVCSTTCSRSFSVGTTVYLAALPTPTSTFTGWSGACTGTDSCTVTMSQARNVTATFTGNPQLLTVNRTGGGAGAVTSAPGGISCGLDCSEIYPYNTPVTLTATAGANSSFAGWSGEGCSGMGTCVVTMSQARTVTASFMADGAAPTITTRTPSRAARRVGPVVIPTGQNFVTGTTVRVGATPVAVLLRGTTELSFVTPAVTAAGVQTDHGSDAERLRRNDRSSTPRRRYADA